MSDLKPCPYQHIEKTDGHNLGIDYETSLPRAACSCGARGPVMSGRESAIEAWNTRQSKWISVEDRLPESGKLVLATYKNQAGKSRRIAGYHLERYTAESSGELEEHDEYCEEKDAFFLREGWYEQQDNWDEYASIWVYEGEVTHWQPLPEPPK